MNTLFDYLLELALCGSLRLLWLVRTLTQSPLILCLEIKLKKKWSEFILIYTFKLSAIRHA